MKIGIIVDVLARRKTGIQYYTDMILTHLKKIDKKNEYVLIHSKDVKLDKKYADFKKLTYYTPKIPFQRLFKTFFIIRILKKEGFDIIHTPTHTSPTLFKLPIKTVTTVHDITPIILPETHSWKSNAFHKYFFPRILKNCDKIIVDSKSTQKDLIEKLGIKKEKIELTYLGLHPGYKIIDKKIVDKELTRLGIKEEYLLFVGTLEPRKNIITLIKAFIELKKKGIKEKLVIAGGKGWNYSKIFNLIKENNLEQEIKFTGYVSEAQLVSLYNGAKIFVYPSTYEGFGLPVLEAMACGCPVITSNVSSLPEVAGDAAILLKNPKDTKELVDTINNLLKNKGKIGELREKGLKQAKKFSWEKCARETIRVYERLCKK